MLLLLLLLLLVVVLLILLVLLLLLVMVLPQAAWPLGHAAGPRGQAYMILLCIVCLSSTVSFNQLHLRSMENCALFRSASI